LCFLCVLSVSAVSFYLVAAEGRARKGDEDSQQKWFYPDPAVTKFEVKVTTIGRMAGKLTTPRALWRVVVARGKVRQELHCGDPAQDWRIFGEAARRL